jgi:drug/metabolite transporter (DMT)-like permease
MTAFLKTRVGLVAALVLLGAIWGFTVPLMKIAVSTGYKQFGLIFWELVISILVLTAANAFQRKLPKFNRAHFTVFLGIAFLGTLIPASLGFIVIKHIPAGVYGITISLVPMFALPIAVGLKLENFEYRRAFGIVLGMCAILALILPSTSLPDPAKAIFVLIACIVPLCYGCEDNFVAKFTLRGMTSVQAVLGASVIGLILVTPVVFLTDQWIPLFQPWGTAEWAILTMGVLHAFAYTGYVWIVGRAGPVFAAQVAYLVTGFAMFWSILILHETYSSWVWLALVLMLTGLFLVHPRGEDHP